MTENAMGGRQDGEPVWVSWIFYEDNVGNRLAPVRVSASVRGASVFNAGRGLIETGPRTPPRAVGLGERLHDSAHEAWLALASDCRRAAAGLVAQAAECEEKANACIAAKQEVA